MVTIGDLPHDVRKWLETEAAYRAVSLDTLAVEYLTDAVLRRKAAAKVVRLPVTGNGGKHG